MQPSGPENPAASQAGLIASALETTRKRLLDLTRRNSLLNFRPRKRDIRIVDELPNPTFQRLLNGQSFILDPAEAESPTAPDGEEPRAPLPLKTLTLPEQGHEVAPKHLDDRLQTPLDAKDLERRCRSLRATARTALDETGANFLYLAIGFLQWYESDHSSETNLAPLLLVPVEITKGKFETSTDTFRYSIAYVEEDIQSNLSLVEKLKEFNRELPAFSEDSDPEAYFRQVSRAIGSASRWSVRREMMLGLFSFSKILMYQDLDPSRWPSGNGPLHHQGVGDLLIGADDEQQGSTGYDLREAYAVDRDPRCAQIPLVVDADSSQHAALVDALIEESNLALHGPPGTGKSQTITNLIAGCLNAGKTVLFVAEKKAALEVVRSRLDDCGLGDFVLELHSHRTNKGQLRRALERRMSLSFPPPRELEQQLGELKEERRRLLQYSEAALAPTPPDGDAIHEIIWLAGRLSSDVPESLAHVELGPIPVLARPERREAAMLAREFAALVRAVPMPARKAWDGIDVPRASEEDHRRILEALAVLRDTTEQITEEVQLAASEGVPVTPRLETIDWLERAPQVLMARERPETGSDGCPVMAEERWREEIRALARDLHSREEYRKASRPLGPSVSLLDWETTEELCDACRRLAENGLGNRTLTDLEIHLGDCNAVRTASAGMISADEEVRALLDRPPTYIDDYETCVGLAELLPRIPRLVRDHPNLGWFSMEFRSTVRDKCSEAALIRERVESIQQELSLDRFESPSDLQQIATWLEGIQGRRLVLLRSNYRQAKRALRIRLANSRLIRRDDAATFFKTAAEVLQDRIAFEANADAESEFGTTFAGLRTDWGGLSRGCEWAEKVELAAGDRFLAQKLSREAEATAQASERAAARVVNHLQRLKERLGSALPGDDYTAMPVRQIADLAAGRADLLEQALSVLRGASVPASQSVRNLALAGGAHLNWLRLSSDIENRTALAESLGSLWGGVDTDVVRLRRAADWAEAILGENIPQEVVAWALGPHGSDRMAKLLPLSRSASRLKAAIRTFSETFRTIGAVDVVAWLSRGSEARTNLLDLSSACTDCLATGAQLELWTSMCRVKSLLDTTGLQRVAEVIRTQSVAPEAAEALVRARLQAAIVKPALESRPELRDFTRARYEGVRKSFVDLDRAIQSRRCQSIANSISGRQVPRGVGRGPIREWTERNLLEHEIGKQRKLLPIRQLVQRSGRALQALKPCFMMSPMSIAQYLAPGSLEFDLLIIDEASQVRPEDALGAVVRAKRSVIVGDPKQLPPTSFFERLGDIEDEDDGNLVAAQESDAILDLAMHAFPSRMLEWHYRSEHESLIAFSNSYFYDGRLIVFPSAYGNSPEYGVKHRFISNGRYRNRRNPQEAREVATAVRDHLVNRPHESLGVATLNAEQRDLILAEIENLQKSDPELDEVLRRHDDEKVHEPFFVKNLENVQGDEREIIFISTTYGPDPDTGKVFQRFGPITGSNGWRRLNVLFTRARRRLVLFTSLRSDDVVSADGRSLGVAALHHYLRFAETGFISEPASETGRSPDSDFELDVARVLRARGFVVSPQVGVAGFFIDVGVKDPGGSGSYVLGIECDGASYHSAASVRDRDRIRQEILERKGWTIHRIWSTDWFNHREAEIERLVRAVEKAARRLEPRHA